MSKERTGVELQAFDLDAASGTYQAVYDPATTKPGMAVIALFVEILDQDPTKMNPLQAAVDTEALDTLLAATDSDSTGVTVSFTYEAHAVTVSNDTVVADSVDSDESVDNSEAIELAVASQ